MQRTGKIAVILLLAVLLILIGAGELFQKDELPEDRLTDSIEIEDKMPVSQVPSDESSVGTEDLDSQRDELSEEQLTDDEEENELPISQIQPDEADDSALQQTGDGGQEENESQENTQNKENEENLPIIRVK